MTPARLIASGLGTGFLPKAPGTWGSLLGLAIGAGLLAWSPLALLAGAGTAILVGVPATAMAARVRVLGGTPEDPGWVVIDEIAGQMLAMLALPRVSAAGLAASFLLFRLLDITKPGPVGWADRRHGALAIMGDDVIAGLSAALFLWALLIEVPSLG